MGAVRAIADRDARIVLCPAHAEPLSRMTMTNAVTIAEACPWCRVQHRPNPTGKDPDPIVFGPPIL